MKKTVLIIIILVALAYIAWRRGWFAKTALVEGKVEGMANPGTGDLTVDEIIARTSMTEYEKDKARKMANSILNAIKSGNSNWTYEAMAQNANKNNITFNKQVVRSATYQLYKSAKIFGKEYWEKISAEIIAM